jgi:predicted 3-demethylubiquinone-9 3-methyltransferase (glyoxalase superfamily)
MKKHTIILWTATIIALLILTTSCSNNKNSKTMANTNQKITPSLWVEKDAKAVADYYLSIFKDGKLKDYRKFENPPNDLSSDTSSFETAVIEIAGMEFSILAAGPLFKFNEAVSFVVNCKDQAEVDYYWEALTANGGEEGSCGWCKDKYGLSWQVVPTEYFELIHSTDATVRDKAMINTFKQKKLIIEDLKK